MATSRATTVGGKAVPSRLERSTIGSSVVRWDAFARQARKPRVPRGAMMFRRILVGSITTAALVACEGEAPRFRAVPDRAAQHSAEPADHAGGSTADRVAAAHAAAGVNPNAIPAPADVAAPPADASREQSGLAWKQLSAGSGRNHPQDGDVAEFHFTVWSSEGQMLDSSRTRNEAARVPLDRLPPGLLQGLKLMVQGESRRFWIPQELSGGRGPGGSLVFDIELVSFETPPPPPPPPETPSDVAAPPADAERTESGLASKVLRPGTGERHPTPQSTVEVHYSGWTTDGQMFDSSVTRGQPATFPLGNVIAGWTEGVQLMVEGEKRRFWIPENLAYGGRPGAPAGMLVFDVELLHIR